MDSEFQRIISLIDVLWIIKGTSRVAAAFEVEHTTSIYSGLLRMSDLVALSPNINFPLYIVTPDIRLEQVRRELARPTFQVLELHKRCAFFSEESLIQHAENIMRWANHPSAIERLAFKVGDLDSCTNKKLYLSRMLNFNFLSNQEYFQPLRSLFPRQSPGSPLPYTFSCKTGNVVWSGRPWRLP